MKKNITIIFLILLGVLARFLPHAPNFTPIGAIAIFSGIYLPRKFAILIPIGAMFISDLFIGFYDWKIMLTVYIGFALMGAIAMLMKKRKKTSTIIGGTLAGSLIFFITTNTAVWAFSGMYTHTPSGLIHCFYMALPFFKNSLIANFAYITVLVGMVKLFRIKTISQIMIHQSDRSHCLNNRNCPR